MNPLWGASSLVLVVACCTVAWTAQRVTRTADLLTLQIHDLRRARAEVRALSGTLRTLDTDHLGWGPPLPGPR